MNWSRQIRIGKASSVLVGILMFWAAYLLFPLIPPEWMKPYSRYVWIRASSSAEVYVDEARLVEKARDTDAFLVNLSYRPHVLKVRDGAFSLEVSLTPAPDSRREVWRVERASSGDLQVKVEYE